VEGRDKSPDHDVVGTCVQTRDKEKQNHRDDRDEPCKCPHADRIAASPGITGGPPGIVAHAQVLVPTINGRGYHLEDIRTRGVWRVPDDATPSEVEAIEASQLAELHALLPDLGLTCDLRAGTASPGTRTASGSARAARPANERRTRPIWGPG